MFLEALLTFNLYVQQMRDRIEHPKELIIETRYVIAEPTIKIGSTTSLTYTIRFKYHGPNRHRRMGGVS